MTDYAGSIEELAAGYAFLEAPRSAPDGSHWFSDLLGGTVYRHNGDGTVQPMLAGRQWVGGIVHDVSGHVLCSGRGGIVALDPATGGTRPVLEEIEGKPIIAVNDMEADGRGGLYAGTIDFVSIMERGTAPEPGCFFHMDASGKVTVLRRDVRASNGIGFSPCGKWLYHSETGPGIWRHALGGDCHAEPELFIPLPDSDGLVVDSDGGIWVACWESRKLLHFNEKGEEQLRLAFGYPHIVSLAFERENPNALLVTTGGNDAAPSAGALLRLNVPTPGLQDNLTALAMLGHG